MLARQRHELLAGDAREAAVGQHRATPSSRPPARRARSRKIDGQRQLALAQVVGHRLAQHLLVRGEVEQVVHHLEADAEVRAVAGEGLLLAPSPTSPRMAPMRMQAEKRSAVLRRMMSRWSASLICRSPLRSISRISPSIMRRVTSESRRRIGQVVLGERHGHRLRVEEVAEQDGDVVAPAAVHAAPAAAHGGLVDDVVVQQGRGVDELHHRGQQDGAVAAVAAERGRPAAAARAGCACRRPRGCSGRSPPTSATSERHCSSKSSSTLTRSSSTSWTISFRSATPRPPRGSTAATRAYL